MTTSSIQERISSTQERIIAPQLAELRVVDRCDSDCNAQARVRVVFHDNDGPGVDHHIDFCGHHFSKFESNLPSEVTIIDERDKIS